MHVFIFEPRETRQLFLNKELTAVGFHTHFIGKDFFETTITKNAGYGPEFSALLISDTSNAKKYIRSIRRAGYSMPVIAISDKKDPISVSELLNAGADDAVASPFYGQELISRIRSIIRRGHGHTSESVTIGELTVYFDGRDPLVSGEELSLSKREHEIFYHLALNAERIVSKNSIYDAIYSSNPDQPFDKVIDVYICKLRKKISESAVSGFSYILTVRGRGYRLCAPVDCGLSSASH